MRELATHYGDMSKSCSRNKAYSNPNSIISKCKDSTPQQLDMDFSAICSCLQIDDLKKEKRNYPNSDLGMVTEEMEDYGIKIDTNYIINHYSGNKI